MGFSTRASRIYFAGVFDGFRMGDNAYDVAIGLARFPIFPM